MAFFKKIPHRIKWKRQVKANLKKNGFSRRQLKKTVREHRNRELNISEILSGTCSPRVFVDAYEYCMRKCGRDPCVLADGNVKDFLLCMLFEGAVANGGISFFLSDRLGDLSAETAEALKRVDEEYAAMLSDALRCFPDGIVPGDCKARNDLMEQFDEETKAILNELDYRAFKHDYSGKYYDFLQAHREDFLNF